MAVEKTHITRPTSIVGPLTVRRRARADSIRTLAKETTVPVMTRGERWMYRALTALWLTANVIFWSWWLRPSHIVTVPRFLITTLIIGYTLAMPAYFFFFLGRMRRPNPALDLPAGLRVAFVTTFVPGAESIAVLERTIVAMRDQAGYPHDVWVLDEGDTPAVKALCARIGVAHFSRKGIDRYQAPAWPFKAKTKAGNYNAWLDWLQGIRYDIILQMDTDHVPQPGYMMEMLRPFADPAVAYVAAPSITSGNRADSWAVAARYEVEATLHGALQMGYNGGYAPLIIGSHAAFRVAALRRIGGFQHTLAEDHHNTLRLNAAGMRGVFSPEAIAIGDGATCFADAMVQEYQWARALTQILLNFFPKDGRTLGPRLWAQFAFAETWYPLFALTQLLGWLAPMIALLTGRPWVRVNYFEFLGIQSIVTLSSLALVWWVKRRGWLRPQDASLISWRSVLLTLARWPFVLMAVGEALLGWMTKRDFPFRVTPKGARGTKALPFRMVLPYLVIVTGSLAAVAAHLSLRRTTDVDGYLYLALLNAAVYVTLIVTVLSLNFRENVRDLRRWENIRERRRGRTRVFWAHAPSFATAFLLVALLTLALPGSGGRIVHALTWQPGQAGGAVQLADAVGVSPPPLAAVTIASSSLSEAAPSGSVRNRPVSDEGSRKDEPSYTVAAPTVVPKQPITLPAGRPFLGIYHPGAGGSTGLIDAEQVFIQWKPNVGDEVRTSITRMLAAGHVPIVTIEPYPWNIDGLSEKTLLSDIAAGRYNGTVNEIAGVVRSFAPQPVYLRFAQEMDLVGVYPWSVDDPDEYIMAYRQFVDTVRLDGASNARFIWSPSGNAGSARYYPGRDIVDMIGVTVLVNQQWEEAAGYKAPRSFAQILRERYSLAGKFQKPLLVAELGVALPDPAAKTAWLAAAKQAIGDFPDLAGVVYFDDKGPPMRLLSERPDWQLTRAQYAALFGPRETETRS